MLGSDKNHICLKRIF